MSRRRPHPLIRHSDGTVTPLYHTATRICGEAVWRQEIDMPPTAAEWLARLRRAGWSRREWNGRRWNKYPPRQWIRPPESLAYGWSCWCDPARLP